MQVNIGPTEPLCFPRIMLRSRQDFFYGIDAYLRGSARPVFIAWKPPRASQEVPADWDRVKTPGTLAHEATRKDHGCNHAQPWPLR